MVFFLREDLVISLFFSNLRSNYKKQAAMFRKTETDIQMTLFDNPSEQMCKRAKKKYNDDREWFNLFYELVTSKVDEEVFRPLFEDGGMGAPNKSVSMLVAMSIIKEGYGCSDTELAEKCDFDLLTRKALGLFRLEDSAPSIDTYYLFRRRVCEYENETGANLVEQCCERLTGLHAVKFKVSGKSVRMDSKLIGSNIAWYPRYELIHRTFLQEIGRYVDSLNPSLRKKVEPWLGEDAKQTVYRSNTETILRRITELGELIYRVLVRVKAKDGLLHRMFNEQYTVEHGRVTARDKKAVSPDSLQNPNDPDAQYREKGDQKVKGYSVNITETTDEKGSPSLITSVQVEGALASDSGFYEEAIEKSGAVTGNRVKTAYCDGAYQSQENRALDADGVFTGMQGRCSRYRLDESPEGAVRVTDTVEGVTYEAKVTRNGSYRIPSPDGRRKWRYITVGQQESMRARRKMADTPQREKNKRNNVEATIFQLCFHSRNNKTRYRGKQKHKLWALARCMWINLRRLVAFVGRICPNGFFSPSIALTKLFSNLRQRIEKIFPRFNAPKILRQRLRLCLCQIQQK